VHLKNGQIGLVYQGHRLRSRSQEQKKAYLCILFAGRYICLGLKGNLAFYD